METVKNLMNREIAERVKKVEEARKVMRERCLTCYQLMTCQAIREKQDEVEQWESELKVWRKIRNEFIKNE